MSGDGFPYTVADTALSSFIGKLKTVAVPPKIDHQYLKSVGFSSSNHRAFVPVLKAINLLDQNGAPTERYKQGLRGDDATQIAGGIRIGYRTLFDVYPNAESLSAADLQKFIAANSNYGERALAAAIKTFQTLCGFGDFESDSGSALPAQPEGKGDSGGDRGAGDGGRRPPVDPSGHVTINVNIALSVDATSDPKVYDAFFAAMAKHIKVLDGTTKSS